MPPCVEINNAMHELIGVQYAASEQHKDVSKSRQARDLKDTTTMLKFLISRNPFTEEGHLCIALSLVSMLDQTEM